MTFWPGPVRNLGKLLVVRYVNIIANDIVSLTSSLIDTTVQAQPGQK